MPGPVVDSGRGLDGAIVFDASLTELDDCAAIVTAEASAVRFTSTALPFDAGRRIVIAQMNDAIDDSSGDTQPVTDLGRAGEWEIAEIATLDEDDATLLAPLKSTYETNLLSGLRAQACLVHEWTDVTIASGATVSPREWDGDTGGILAAQIAGTLFVDAGGRLSADASGFRGGMCGLPSSSANVSAFDVPDGSGGGKGEGLDARFFTLFGRGAVANAGGGGNGLNAGGGGGGGAGAGGAGGRQKGSTATIVVGDETTHGLAGGAARHATRLVFGGGGGSGHLDSLTLAQCGGAGGGALVIRAKALAGTGVLSANGGSGRQLERNGAGGGGAGGTIDLAAATTTLFTGAIVANGGEGGDVTAGFFSTTTYGPGGGGGGGHVRATGVAPSPAIRADGGVSGMNEANGFVAGAAGGDDGSVTLP